MQELENCPFCGSEYVEVESARAPDEGFQVQCTLCEACGPLSASHSAAVEAWNERE